MKFYKVTCRGMQVRLGGYMTYGIAYVVAKDSERAYRAMRTHLDKRNLGFANERELLSVELLAEASEYPSCGMVLHLDA